MKSRLYKLRAVRLSNFIAHDHTGIQVDNHANVISVFAVLEIGNITKNMDEALNKAKTALEKMSNKYDNITEYSTLKNYYSDTLAFYNFVKSPSGNFASFTPTITSYETKADKYESQLGFIYKTN